MITQPARRSGSLLVAVVVMLLAGHVRADVAETGTFDLTVDLSGLPNPGFDGNITFTAGSRTAIGQSVDLAAAVGPMTYEGAAQVNTANRSATFNFTAESGSDFEFTASGAGACDTSGCLNGQATFAGRFGTLTDPTNALPDAVYTFDGTVFVSFLGQGPGGTFGINAFAPVPTPAGSNVEVASASQFFDSRAGADRSFEAIARFQNVTGAGQTDFVALSAVPGALPSGVELIPGVSVFIDVTTSAAFTGTVDICFPFVPNIDGTFDDSTVLVNQLRVLHAPALGSPFVDVTTSVGTTSPSSGRACGTVTSLSPVVLAANPSLTGSTTTTISPGGGTTTTTLPPLGDCSEPVACLETALGAPLCQGEQVNPKLAAIIAKKLGKARTLLQKAGTVAASKVAKLIVRARKQLDKVGGKADAFVTKKKGPITAGCRDGIRAALDQIGQAITDNPPTGTTGGGGGAGVQATITGLPDFQGVGFFYDEFPSYAEGCERFPGSSSKECKRLITFSIENSPLGTPQTIVQPEAVVPFMTYSEYPIPSPSVSADIVYSSTTGTIIEVTGLSNGRLQGRFSGTFNEIHPNLGGGTVEIVGTFSVPEKQRPF